METKEEEIYVFLDESGNIHKNSKCIFFAIGGYFCSNFDRIALKSKYKKIIKGIKNKNNIPLDFEMKSFNFSEEDKINIFKEIQKFDDTKFIGKVFNKEKMYKSPDDINLFYNFSVNVLFKDCILPQLNKKKKYIINLHLDSRNIKFLKSKKYNKDSRMLFQLEDYLNTTYWDKNFNFKVKYIDSSTNFNIQLADLVINTIYNKYKDITIVKNVLKTFKLQKFNISIFPYKKY